MSTLARPISCPGLRGGSMDDGSRKSAALYTLLPELESGLSYGDNAVERRSTVPRMGNTLPCLE